MCHMISRPKESVRIENDKSPNSHMCGNKSQANHLFNRRRLDLLVEDFELISQVFGCHYSHMYAHNNT